ncbi:MAG TPA: DUF4912 domain-containing protein [Anaeromyxobacteraceae bacterium]|jgi:hypothetical protein|nr:DUF4912 domain-containing protein [Anaeromyxobacteraceae bacterium]
MADFKNMTVRKLRELAHKMLGRGYSKLTKGELVEALEAAEKKASTQAGKAAAKVKRATGRAARATRKVVKEAQNGASRAREQAEAKHAAAPPRKARGTAGRAVQRAGRAVQTLRETAEAAAAAAVAGARAVVAAARGEEEPDPESYFVARVRGEAAVKKAPHPMTEGAVEKARGAKGAPLDAEDLEDEAAEGSGAEGSAPAEWEAQPRSGRQGAAPARPAYDEELGELPWSYGDDAFVALPRDPRTLFLYWDYSTATLARGFQRGGRAQLWIFGQRGDGGWERLRAIDFALESRSFYVHDLEPGRSYRAEVHVVDRAGEEHALAHPSNEVLLPPFGASPIVDDRFARILWGESLIRWLQQSVAGGLFSADVRAQLARLSDWSRFRTGESWGPGGGSGAGGMGGRPTSPSSPFGPSGGGRN